jgi:ribonucleoside-diphosphate reductase alpha chain
MAQSIMDYVFRRLALDYLDFDTRSFIGLHTAEERQRQLETGSYAPVASDTAEESDEDTEAQIEAYSQSVSMKPSHKAPTEDVKSGTGAASARTIDDATVHSSAELMEKFQGKAADAPMCMTCGTKMRPAGSCYVCEGCGSTSGCS